MNVTTETNGSARAYFPVEHDTVRDENGTGWKVDRVNADTVRLRHRASHWYAIMPRAVDGTLSGGVWVKI